MRERPTDRTDVCSVSSVRECVRVRCAAAVDRRTSRGHECCLVLLYCCCSLLLVFVRCRHSITVAAVVVVSSSAVRCGLLQECRQTVTPRQSAPQSLSSSDDSRHGADYRAPSRIKRLKEPKLQKSASPPPSLNPIARMASNAVPVLLITANVGSIFEEVCAYLFYTVYMGIYR